MSEHYPYSAETEEWHWPVILLPEENTGIVKALGEKTLEYEERIFVDIDHAHVPLALMADYHERYADTRYQKTSAMLKWIIADEVLQKGACDTQELNRRLHEERPYIEYFVSIQQRDMARFDALALNAAHVIDGYVRGDIPIRRNRKLA